MEAFILGAALENCIHHIASPRSYATSQFPRLPETHFRRVLDVTQVPCNQVILVAGSEATWQSLMSNAASMPAAGYGNCENFAVLLVMAVSHFPFSDHRHWCVGGLMIREQAVVSQVSASTAI